MSTELTLDPLKKAIWARKVKGNLIHHSGRGSQYLSIRYSERLAEIRIQASVGSAGGAYDNALAETTSGLFKAEVVWRRGSWWNREDVEHATLEWVHWFNTERLLEPVGNIPPCEFEKLYYDEQGGLAIGAGLNLRALRQTRGDSVCMEIIEMCTAYITLKTPCDTYKYIHK